MDINPRTIEYVLAVAQEQSFSKAAQKLYISQPSLSQHIIKAEKNYGVQFFDRSSVPLKLTYAGERFIALSKEIQRIDTQITLELQDIAGNKAGRIIVGASSTRGAIFIPRLFAGFKSKYPHIELVLREASNAELLQMVRDGTIDCAFVGYTEPDLESKMISKREILLAAPKNTLPEKTGQIDLADLAGLPFVLLHKGQSLRKIADKLFERAGFLPVVAYETKSYTMAMRLTEVGFGCSFAIDADPVSAEVAQRLRIKENPYTYPLYLATRKNHYVSQPFGDLIALSMEIGREIGCG